MGRLSSMTSSASVFQAGGSSGQVGGWVGRNCRTASDALLICLQTWKQMQT